VDYFFGLDSFEVGAALPVFRSAGRADEPFCVRLFSIFFGKPGRFR
jgi:hypothetical protein